MHDGKSACSSLILSMAQEMDMHALCAITLSTMPFRVIDWPTRAPFHVAFECHGANLRTQGRNKRRRRSFAGDELTPAMEKKYVSHHHHQRHHQRHRGFTHRALRVARNLGHAALTTAVRDSFFLVSQVTGSERFPEQAQLA
mmetsp:Transcript_18508/g.36299  ORF Transcript_18508/g.36299 Transcript_18508/m.36299 type:complete len:142 (+) Transcript_18508:2305-2730(+)